MENSKTISILNDLLHIINDRLEGFEKVEGKVWEKNHQLKDQYEHITTQNIPSSNKTGDFLNSKYNQNGDFGIVTERKI